MTTYRLAWVLFIVAACAPDPVGRLCDLGSTPNNNEVLVGAPSLDCVSRTCLHVPAQAGSMAPGGTTGLCTAACTSDDDCQQIAGSPCVSGFTCGVPLVNGPFCCEKLCICKDYVVVPTTGEVELDNAAQACDPNNAANTCCNLEGRTNNPSYPLCKG